jgi:serine/threonine protein kinase
MSWTIRFRRRSALAGRYRFDREIGRGGMATVCLAEDLKHARPAAIKVLRSDLASGVGADRFLREIAIAGSLDHPHILRLHDSGAVEPTGGQPPVRSSTAPSPTPISLPGIPGPIHAPIPLRLSHCEYRHRGYLATATLPTDESRPHTLAGAFSLRLPGDWKCGSLAGNIMRNVDVFATFRCASGSAYSKCGESTAEQSVLSAENCLQSFPDIERAANLRADRRRSRVRGRA